MEDETAQQGEAEQTLAAFEIRLDHNGDAHKIPCGVHGVKSLLVWDMGRNDRFELCRLKQAHHKQEKTRSIKKFGNQKFFIR